jgi:hypothetical protein
MIRKMYLKFEVDTFKTKEFIVTVIFFKLKNLSKWGDNSCNIGPRVMYLVT